MVALIRTKYDETMATSSSTLQKTIPKSAAPSSQTIAPSQSAALKSSFNQMLSKTGTGVSQLALGVSNEVSSVKISNSLSKPVVGAGGKKLTLADLAKGKK
jgi:hypothetical protein